MRMSHHIGLIICTIALSSFGSSMLNSALMGLLISGGEGNGDQLFVGPFTIIFIATLIMTAVLGVPASLLILWLFNREDALGMFMKGALHALSGAIGLDAYAKLTGADWSDLFDPSLFIFYLFASVQGGIYFIVYMLLKRFILSKIAKAEERKRLLNCEAG